MPGAVTTKQIRDGSGTLLTFRLWDESGAGTGPYSFFSVLGADGVKLAKAEDAASANGDEGIIFLAKRSDTPANSSGTDGDYEPPQVSGGYLWVKPGATEVHLGEIGAALATPSANFTRPADTTAYASGDLVANSTTAGSVAAMQFTAARVAAGSGVIRRARLKKSTTGVTSASFRLHLYGSDPAASSGIINGDNGAWLTKIDSYLGSISLDMSGSNGRVFNDAAWVVGAPDVGSEINFKLASGQIVYGLLEARGAYTPGNAEVFTAELEVLQN